MKKLYRCSIVVLSLGMILSACGTKKSETAGSKIEKQEEQSTTATEPKQPKNETKEETPSTQLNDGTTKELSYSQNGEMKKEVGEIKKSDNQQFYVHLLPNFTLAGEEPGRDLIYKNDDETTMMRIELLEANPDWNEMNENTMAILHSLSDKVTEVTDQQLQIPNAVSFEATNGTDTITTYLIKDEMQPIRLTIFTKNGSDIRNALIAMGKTISKIKE